MPAKQHRFPPAHALSGQAGRQPGRSFDAGQIPYGAQGSHFDWPAGQRGRSAAGTGAPRQGGRPGAGPGDGPDVRARPGQRLFAARLERVGLEGGAAGPAAPRAPDGGRRRFLRRPRAGHARFPRHGRAYRRLRQQHPPGGVRPGRAECLRLPRFRARLHPPAILRRAGAVPLGGPVGRPGRHL